MCTCAGADSDASSDSAPEMRYASDESDSDDDASPATKRKARKAKKAKAGSDEDDNASPVARRPKSRRRGAAAKMAEEVRLAKKGQKEGHGEPPVPCTQRSHGLVYLIQLMH